MPIRGLLGAGDPQGEVRLAWHAKETLDPATRADLSELVDDLTDTDCPCPGWVAPWVVGITRSSTDQARVTNGPTEAVNNLIKRVKRTAFGFRRFSHYRIRALLYAGKPNWTLLNTITPR